MGWAPTMQWRTTRYILYYVGVFSRFARNRLRCDAQFRNGTRIPANPRQNLFIHWCGQGWVFSLLWRLFVRPSMGKRLSKITNRNNSENQIQKSVKIKNIFFVFFVILGNFWCNFGGNKIIIILYAVESKGMSDEQDHISFNSTRVKKTEQPSRRLTFFSGCVNVVQINLL